MPTRTHYLCVVYYICAATDADAISEESAQKCAGAKDVTKMHIKWSNINVQ